MSIASEVREVDELSVILLGTAQQRPDGRPTASTRLLWELIGRRGQVAEGPSWRLPPLWDVASDRPEDRFSADRVTPRGLPAYKRTFRQPALF